MVSIVSPFDITDRFGVVRTADRRDMEHIDHLCVVSRYTIIFT